MDSSYEMGTTKKGHTLILINWALPMSQFWRKSKVKPIETNDLSNHRRHLDIFRNMRNGNICLFRMVAFLLMAATCSIRIAVIILVYGLLLGGMPLGDFVLCTHSVLS